MQIADLENGFNLENPVPINKRYRYLYGSVSIPEFANLNFL